MIPIIRFIFPFPDPPQYSERHPNLYYIPSRAQFTSNAFSSFLIGKSEENVIPVMFINEKNNFKKIIIYFHGNAEDASCSVNNMQVLGNRLSASVMIVEYPQYGVYKHRTISESQIFSDAETVYDFCVNKMRYSPRNIIIAGRSIGTGPAIYLASIKKARLLSLITPYLSIKKIAISRTILGHLITDIFNSEKYLPNVKCPIFVLHGKQDETIPYSQAEGIYNMMKNKVLAKLVTPSYMTHNEFNFDNDLIEPLKNFAEKAEATGNIDVRDSNRFPNTSALLSYSTLSVNF